MHCLPHSHGSLYNNAIDVRDVKLRWGTCVNEQSEIKHHEPDLQITGVTSGAVLFSGINSHIRLLVIQ